MNESERAAKTDSARKSLARELATTAAHYGSIGRVLVQGEYNRSWIGTAELDGQTTHWGWIPGRGWEPEMRLDEHCRITLRDAILVGRY